MQIPVMPQPPKLEKATTLVAMLRAFKLEPLKEEDMAEFFYDDTMAIRTGEPWNSPLKLLLKSCTTPTPDNAHLLLGHRGCGKSTELTNLKQQIEAEGQPVWTFDCALELDLFRANCWDIMLLITEGLCKIAEKRNIELPTATVEAVLDYLKKDTEIIDIVGDSFTIGASAGVETKTPSLLGSVLKAFASVKMDAQLSAGTREVAKEKIEKRSSEWLSYTKMIANFITHGCEGKQPVIIFESLDKLPIPENIFKILQAPALAKMPFPIVYTFPMSQSYSPDIGTVRDMYTPHILPMIKITNLDQSENEEGIAAITEIIKKRVDLSLFDDTEDVYSLKYMIQKTGGSLRHLFECISNASHRAEWRGSEKIQLEDAKSALSGLRIELTRIISYPDYEKLNRISDYAEYRESKEDKEFLLEMTKASIIFEYQNGGLWHDLHPLIAEFLKGRTKR